MKKINDVIEKYSGQMYADAYCWCIYENVNARMKESVEKLAVVVEIAIAELESSQP